MTSLGEVERLLLLVEADIRLLESLTPLNFQQERVRLEGELQRGVASAIRFIYRDDRLLSERADAADRALDRAEQALLSLAAADPRSPWVPDLLRGRIGELRLESEMVRACGTSQVVVLARCRFRFSDAELNEARQLAREWLDAGASGVDERCGAERLTPQLEQFAAAYLQDFGTKIQVQERSLASVAAVGGSTLYVRSGASTSRSEARRIWTHEVLGHLLPRLRALKEPAPFQIGTADCASDEEGRAILLEERALALSRDRKYELALRFVLGLAAREDPDTVHEIALGLVRDGASPHVVARTLARVMRGGGLAREVCYLAAYLRVKAAFSVTPTWEIYFERGRISVHGARKLSESALSDRRTQQ